MDYLVEARGKGEGPPGPADLHGKETGGGQEGKAGDLISLFERKRGVDEKRGPASS